MRRPFITITGVHEVGTLQRLSELDAEFALLYNYKADKINPNNRYALWSTAILAGKWMRRVALHVCGNDTIKSFKEDIGYIQQTHFRRIQINGSPSVEDVIFFCRMLPDRIIITQHNEKNKHLVDEVNYSNHAILIDESWGNGILPEKWEVPATSKQIGFAGGLNEGNLPEQISQIIKACPTFSWIDIESGVRNKDDVLDVDCVERTVALFHQLVNPLASVLIKPMEFPDSNIADVMEGKVNHYYRELMQKNKVMDKMIYPDIRMHAQKRLRGCSFANITSEDAEKVRQHNPQIRDAKADEPCVIPFGDLTVGDRFFAYNRLWTKTDEDEARVHSEKSLALGERGYGYIGDSICSFHPEEQVLFVSPRTPLVT